MPGSAAAGPGLRCLAALAGLSFVPFAAYGRVLSWLIRASWLIRGIPVHRINRGARIHRGNRRTPPPGVAAAVSCGDCDAQGETGDHALTVAGPDGQPAGRPDRCPQLARSLLTGQWATRPGGPTPPGPARSEESRRERGLDHQTAHGPGLMVVGIIKYPSFGQNVTSTPLRTAASALRGGARVVAVTAETVAPRGNLPSSR